MRMPRMGDAQAIGGAAVTMAAPAQAPRMSSQTITYAKWPGTPTVRSEPEIFDSDPDGHGTTRLSACLNPPNR
jgi:hypothetical protein